MHGLFECILGGRVDMCPCTDIDGKNKNDAGTDYGSASLPWGGDKRIRHL